MHSTFVKFYLKRGSNDINMYAIVVLCIIYDFEGELYVYDFEGETAAVRAWRHVP